MIIENLKYRNTLLKGITLFKEEYKVVVYDHHKASCCGEHYLDWSYAIEEFHQEQTFTLDTDNIEKMISKVPGYGIIIIPNKGTGHPIPVPGYGSNNDFYNDAIYLVIEIYKGSELIGEFRHDYSECQDIDWKV